MSYHMGNTKSKSDMNSKKEDINPTHFIIIYMDTDSNLSDCTT